jgi:hypothetical protein
MPKSLENMQKLFCHSVADSFYHPIMVMECGRNIARAAKSIEETKKKLANLQEKTLSNTVTRQIRETKRVLSAQEKERKKLIREFKGLICDFKKGLLRTVTTFDKLEQMVGSGDFTA